MRREPVVQMYYIPVSWMTKAAEYIPTRSTPRPGDTNGERPCADDDYIGVNASKANDTQSRAAEDKT